MGEIVVVTGLSGAGRSTAADVFEDLGWFVVDGLPAALIPKIAELAHAAPGTHYDRVVLVVGATPELEQVAPALDALRATGTSVRTVFLEAGDETLIRRYKEGRRRHPFSTGSLTEAIARERQALENVKAGADLVINTTDLNVHQLKDRVLDVFSADDRGRQMRTSVLSFGYKHGLPLDVDVVVDCRFLPNPFWEPELRPLTGRDESVRTYVLGHAAAKEFLDRLEPLLETIVPAYLNEGKAYLTIAFGCTGGRHRSVAIAEEVARVLTRLGMTPEVAHRDIDR
jgi:RNase adapter protein RapZ